MSFNFTELNIQDNDYLVNKLENTSDAYINLLGKCLEVAINRSNSLKKELSSMYVSPAGLREDLYKQAIITIGYILTLFGKDPDGIIKTPLLLNVSNKTSRDTYRRRLITLSKELNKYAELSAMFFDKLRNCKPEDSYTEAVKESIPVSSMDHYVNEDTRIAQTIIHLNDLYETTQDNASSNEVVGKYHIRALYKTLKYICINHHVDYNRVLAELPEPAEIDCCDNDIKTKARTKLLAVIKSLSNYFVDLSKKVENKISNIIDANSLVRSADKSSSPSNNKLDNIAVSLKGEDRVIFNIKPLSAIKNFNNLTSPDTVAVKVNVTIKNNNILYDDVRIAIDKFLEIVNNYHPCEQYIVNPKTPDGPVEYYHNTSVLSDRTYTYGLGNDAVLGLYDLDNIYIYVPNVYIYNDGVWELDTNLIYNSLKEFVNNNTNIFTLKG